MKVGFIGLGIMGKPMSKNLLKAGYELIISSSNEQTNGELQSLGAKVVSSLKEVGEESDVIITMLPNSPEVKKVILGEDGLITSVKSGATIIDMSSIAPIASQEIGEELRKQEIGFLDAPVSGGEPKAIDGTLSVMVGGKEELFEKYLPLLKAMAGSVVKTGEIGSGNATKLANQIIVALNIAAVSEAFVLASKIGVSPDIVHEAIRGGLAGSTVLDAKAPMMMERNFEPGFKINLHLKDLNNVLETSHEVGVPLPLTAAVREMMQAVKVNGNGEKDHSSLVQYYEQLAKVKVEK
ncbi:2-hydroxy-3-oxopropionate reductase [bacterium LRH843]|nr:2-hydroxy-3-oxopropionate reductase [bacterium LRH843]